MPNITQQHQSHLKTNAELLIQGIDTTSQPHKRLITLGEGALWHNEAQRFVYIDIEAPSINFYTPSTQQHESYNIKQILEKQQDNKIIERIPRIGTIVATNNKDLYLIAIQHEQGGISIFDYNTHTIKPYAVHTEWQLQYNRYNDGKVSPANTLYVGTMVVDEAPKRDPNANFYKIHKHNTDTQQGQSTLLFDGVTISNGLIWSLDHTTLYYIDTPKQQIDSFKYDKTNDTIDINSRKTIIKTNASTDGCMLTYTICTLYKNASNLKRNY